MEQNPSPIEVPGYWELYKDLCSNCTRGYKASVLNRFKESDLNSGVILENVRQGLAWQYLFAWLTMLQQIPVIVVLTIGLPLATGLFLISPLINLISLPLARYHLICRKRDIEQRRELELQFRARKLRERAGGKRGLVNE